MSTVTRALEGLDEVSLWQEELYRHLHAHPELSFQEVETRAEIARRLGDFGYEVQEIGGGVVGVLRNGEGPTVLFRADIDALPVTEATGLDYASTVTATDADGATVGVMHACGHDSHITCALGAAALLAQRRDTWSGTYLALFQPAEELGLAHRPWSTTGCSTRSRTPTSAWASTSSPRHRPGTSAPWPARCSRPGTP